MRIPWRAREYERTCANCGYVWHAPRPARVKPIAGFSAAPRGRPVSLGGIDPVVPDTEPELVGSEEISQAAAAFAQCPKCGSDDYTERRAR